MPRCSRLPPRMRWATADSRACSGPAKVEDDGDFPAVGKERTANAFAPYLLWEFHYVGDAEALLLEEAWAVSQSENPFNPQGARFGHAGGDNGGADAASLCIFADCKRAHFGNIRSKDVEGAATRHYTAVPRHLEVADRFEHLSEGAMQHVAAIGPEGDQVMDGFGIGEGRRLDTNHVSAPVRT